MKIGLIMSLYNESQLIENTLDSIVGNSKYECDVHINLSGPRFLEKNIEALEEINKKEKNYTIFMHSFGDEVSNKPGHGNSMLIHKAYYEMNYDIVAAGSPDYVLKDKSGFNNFIDQSLEYLEDKYCVSCVEYEGSNLRNAFVIITKKRIEEVGFIDPNFVPSGFSDPDLHRRCLMTFNPGQSLEYYNSPENDIHAPYGKNIMIPSEHTSYTKHGTLGIDATNFYFKNNADLLNREYYKCKWGSAPATEPGQAGEEKYLTPFNDPDIPLRITYENLQNGYSEYDRKDTNLLMGII